MPFSPLNKNTIFFIIFYCNIKFVKRSDNEVKDLMSMLRNKAFLERESDVNVIWNAQGNVPMVSGSHMKIQDLEYVTLGVLYENHLVVQYKGEKG